MFYCLRHIVRTAVEQFRADRGRLSTRFAISSRVGVGQDRRVLASLFLRA